MVCLYPVPEALDVCSHECLLEESAHRRPNHNRLIRIYVLAQQDESSRSDGSRGSQECPKITKRLNLTQHRPAGELIGLNLFNCLDSLMKNGSDAGRMFRAGNTPERFW